MMYKQAMKAPVLLVIVGVTFMLCGQVSTSCSCSGYVTSNGRGECNTSYRGKKYCFVNPGQCSDQIKSSFSSRFWSYQACEKSSSPLPQVHKTQLIRALAEPFAQRTTHVGRERVTVTQTTRTPVSQVSGKYYNVNKDGFINCQTREDCPPNFETSNYDTVEVEDAQILCGEELKVLHALLKQSPYNYTVHCCDKGKPTTNEICGNGTRCDDVCGNIPTCAKLDSDSCQKNEGEQSFGQSFASGTGSTFCKKHVQNTWCGPYGPSPIVLANCLFDIFHMVCCKRPDWAKLNPCCTPCASCTEYYATNGGCATATTTNLYRLSPTCKDC